MTSPPKRATRPIEEPVLLRSEAQGVVTLTLNRPGRFNALSEALLAELQSAIDDLAADPTVRVVVIAAAGPAFCAGHDLAELRARREREYYEELFRRCSHLMMSLVGMPQPVIARVHGLATAAGCQLVATCDLAVAAREARFAVSGVTLGLFCSTPAVALSRNVGRKPAFEMLVTGDFIDAPSALALGLVNRVVAAEALDAELERLAASIVAKPAGAVEMGKRLFYRQVEEYLEAAYARAAGVMACNIMTEEAGEGIDAFLEKRPPRWVRP